MAKLPNSIRAQWLADGWVIEMTAKSHLKLTHLDASMVIFAPGTPSDRRSILNVETKMRRALREGALKAA